jgi:hypothetical protein
MQTFLPYPTYTDSVACLDSTRLGNQVYNEGIILIRGGWSHHPASKMWQGYEHHLALYLLAGIKELSKRGLEYPETHKEILQHLDAFPNTGPPHWLGNVDFHASHRSNLLRKNFRYYSQIGWTEPPNLPYIWPKGYGKLILNV